MNIFWAFILALISPIVYALMNTVDKYIASRKIKNVFAFSVVGGIVYLAAGILISLFLSWDGITWTNSIFSIIPGVLLGGQFYIYYFAMKKEDSSYLVGLMYTYPILVALLSFLFLNEILSIYGYIGIALILSGVLMMSIRLKKIKFKVSLWLILVITIMVALSEFSVKISTNNIPAMNGLVINFLTAGLILVSALLFSSVRKDFPAEFKHLPWVVLSEILSFFALGTLYFAMTGLPATIVSSIAAIQPLAALFFERVADKLIGKMQRDHLILPKLGSILLIVIGVILLYTKEILILMS